MAMLNNQRVDFMAGVSNTKLNRIWKLTYIAGWGHLVIVVPPKERPQNYEGQ